MSEGGNLLKTRYYLLPERGRGGSEDFEGDLVVFMSNDQGE